MRFSPQSVRPLRLGLITALTVLAVDQAVKLWIVNHVMVPPREITLTPFFNLVMVWNQGVSFGLFSTASPHAPYLLSAMALGICLVLGWWMLKAETVVLRLALGLIIGGALGNVIDRLRWGAVADFFDLHAFGWHWPAFNVADAAITTGAVLIVWDALFGGRDSNKTIDG